MAMDQDVVVDETSPTYCTVDDVYQVLQQESPGPTSSGGSLSNDQVQEEILDVEDHVDEWTGQAWRPRQVQNERPPVRKRRNVERYTKFYLRNQPVKTIDAAEGDKVEVWNGSTYEDYIANQTEGRSEDWYINLQKGTLYIRPLSVFQRHRGLIDRDDLVKITYRYGHDSVPRSIKRATAMLTAASISSGDTVSIGGMGGEMDRLSLDSKERRWVTKAYTVLNKHRGVGF